MARNGIEDEFRTSKMADGSHFVKQFFVKKSCVWIWNGQKSQSKVGISDIQNEPTAAILSKISKKRKLRIDLKWPEIQSKVNFGHPKWAAGGNFSKNFKIKLKGFVLIWNGQKCDRKWFSWTFDKMGYGVHFV